MSDENPIVKKPGGNRRKSAAPATQGQVTLATGNSAKTEEVKFGSGANLKKMEFGSGEKVEEIKIGTGAKAAGEPDTVVQLCKSVKVTDAVVELGTGESVKTVTVGTGASVTSVIIGNGNIPVKINGNLEVTGGTTTVSSTNTVYSDTLLGLQNGLASTDAPVKDAGLIIKRGSQSNAFIGFDEDVNKFRMAFTTSGADFSGDAGLAFTNETATLMANLEGNATTATTVTGAAQTAITSVGTLTGLTVTNPISGSVTGSASTAATVTGAAQTAITSVGTLTGLTVTNPISGSVTGSAATVTGASQTAITSVGTLTGLTVTGAINANGGVIGNFTVTSASRLVIQNVKPFASDGTQGEIGDFTYKDEFLYIKLAEGRWRRIPLQTFE